MVLCIQVDAGTGVSTKLSPGVKACGWGELQGCGAFSPSPHPCPVGLSSMSWLGLGLTGRLLCSGLGADPLVHSDATKVAKGQVLSLEASCELMCSV